MNLWVFSVKLVMLLSIGAENHPWSLFSSAPRLQSSKDGRHHLCIGDIKQAEAWILQHSPVTLLLPSFLFLRWTVSGSKIHLVCYKSNQNQSRTDEDGGWELGYVSVMKNTVIWCCCCVFFMFCWATVCLLTSTQSLRWSATCSLIFVVKCWS